MHLSVNILVTLASPAVQQHEKARLQPLRGTKYIIKEVSETGSRLTSHPLDLLMETHLTGYNIDLSTTMHFTAQEGNKLHNMWDMGRLRWPECKSCERASDTCHVKHHGQEY